MEQKQHGLPKSQTEIEQAVQQDLWRGKMSKVTYKDFSNFMLRYYFKVTEADFKTNADKLNWEAAAEAVGELDEKDKTVITQVFGNCTPLQQNVSACRKKTGVGEPEIWNIIKRVLQRVAELRGLI